MTYERQASNVQILRLPQVCKLTGLGRSLIYQMEAEQRFPGRIKISARAVGWLEGEVREWIVKRIDNRESAAMRPRLP
jgi:prophage regulatory protein